MKSRFLTASAILAMASVSFAATAYINQIGYRTSDFKELTLFEGSGNVDFVDQSGKTVLSVTPSAAANWDGSGQSVQLVDFTELKTPGTYTIKVNGQEVRKDLKIADNAYGDVSKALLKWFYYQRASMALEEQYAGKWKRSAGHLDNNVSFHSSATGGSGTLNSPKGWYDAGDYGKYIVNSGISTYTLLSLYEHFPAYFDNLKWNIPAEGNLPDLLAEIKYNLDWMLTMQASDGGVYHKLTTLQFCGTVMPNEDIDKRYVIGKS
ncbi:MAG: glycoside hydrolase family 9 protein, partial [Fibrobacter sp.]|nr:glycoside hydrolase family 9 protein [Fibrobacter sp.]